MHDYIEGEVTTFKNSYQKRFLNKPIGFPKKCSQILLKMLIDDSHSLHTLSQKKYYFSIFFQINLFFAGMNANLKSTDKNVPL